MTNNTNANELAREITNDARRRVDTIRQLSAELGIPEKDVQAYVDKLAYRKAYNARPEVIAKRKLRNAEKAAAMRVMKQRLAAAGRLATLEALVK